MPLDISQQINYQINVHLQSTNFPRKTALKVKRNTFPPKKLHDFECSFSRKKIEIVQVRLFGRLEWM